MKRIKSALLSTACALFAAVALPAQATTVVDNYVGFSGTKECMGDEYCISSADVTLTNTNVLTITINTVFAGLAGTTFLGQTVGGTGIGYGDLFLASSLAGQVFPTANDDASNGVVWTYGLALDSNRFTSGDTGGTATLYKLGSGDNNIDALLSDAFMTAPLDDYRNGQEVAVDTTSGGVTNSGIDGSWSAVGASDTVSFTVDLTGTDLEGTLANGIAFHWGMTCANDTIEGGIDAPNAVPVPASIWLMASGLLGLVSVARRRRK